MAPEASQPGGVPSVAVDDHLRSYFPYSAFDGRCSYPRPIRRSESPAHYSATIEQPPDHLTDLDCFIPGRAEWPPRAGMTARYYYANSFLIIRQGGADPLSDLPSFIRASGLDRVPPTGEIYYLLTVYAGESGLFACAQRLAIAAAQGGVLEAAEYWRALEDLRERPPGPNDQVCTDPTYLSLLPPERR